MQITKKNLHETSLKYTLSTFFWIFGENQNPGNIQFFLGITTTFQKLPTFFGNIFYFLVFLEQNGCTCFFITNIFGIFASHYRKNYPRCNISLVKCQIFLLFMQIFLGARFLGSSENLDSDFVIPGWLCQIQMVYFKKYLQAYFQPNGWGIFVKHTGAEI